MDQDVASQLEQSINEHRPNDPAFRQLVYKIAMNESGGQQGLVSDKGAVGPMQIMPKTAGDYGVDTETASPAELTDVGVKHLAAVYNHFHGDPVLTPAAYFSGVRRVEQAGGVPNVNDGHSTAAQYVANVNGDTNVQPRVSANPAPQWSAADAMKDFDAKAPAQAPSASGGPWDVNAAMADFDKTNPPPPPPPPPPENAFQTIGRSFTDTLKGTVQTGYGLFAMASNAASNLLADHPDLKAIADEGASWGWGKYKESEQAQAATAQPSDELRKAYDDWSQNGNFGSLVKWGEHGIGMLLGYGAQMGGASAVAKVALARLVGGAAASVATAAGTTEGMSGGGWWTRLMASKVEDAAAKIAASPEAAGATEEAIHAAAVKQVGNDILSAGRTASGELGIGAFNVATMTGQTYGAAREQNNGQPLDDEQLARNTAGGIAAGLIGTVAGVTGLRSLTKGGMALTSKLSMPGRMLGGAAVLGASGAAEMTGMTAASRWGAGQPVTGEEANNAYLNAAGLGFLGGGLTGAASGLRAPAPLPKGPPSLTDAKDTAAKAAVAVGLNDPNVGLEQAIQGAADAQSATDVLREAVSTANQTANEALKNAAGPGPDERLGAGVDMSPKGNGFLEPGGPGERFVTGQYMQRIEERGGKALPHEAEHLLAVGAGRPYDEILPAEPLSEPAGARPNGAAPDALVEQLKSVNTPQAGQLLADVRAGRIPIEDAQKAADKLTGEGVQNSPAFTKREQPVAPPANAVEAASAQLAAAKAQAPAPAATPGERLAAAAAEHAAANEPPPAPTTTLLNAKGEPTETAPAPRTLVSGDTVPVARADGTQATATIVSPEDLPKATPVSPPHQLNQVTGSLLDSIGRLTGDKINFTQPVKGLEGWQDPTRPGEVFISTDAKFPHLALAGHEIFHVIDQKYPDIADKFREAVAAQLTPEGAERFKANYGQMSEANALPGGLNKPHLTEISADLMGSAWMKTDFWGKVFDHIGTSTGMGVKEVARLAALVQRAVRAVLKAFGGNKSVAAEGYVRDLQAVHDAAATAYSEYAKRQGYSAREMEIHRLTAAQDVSRVPLAKRGEVSGATTRGGLAEPQMRGHFEVAPDPNDKVASAAWNKMPAAEKTRVSLVTAERLVPKILGLMGLKGDLEPQIGGWKDDTNPSFMLKLQNQKNLPQVARVLGHVLNQESVAVVSDRPFEGSNPMHELKISLPKDMNYAELADIYAKLRKITPEKKPAAELPEGATPLTPKIAEGEPIISVSSASVDGRDMRVLHDQEATGISTAELSRRIVEQLGPDYKVEARPVEAQFLERKDYGYENGPAEQAGGGAADLLRNEASRMVASEIGATAAKNSGGAEAGTAGEGVGTQGGRATEAVSGKPAEGGNGRPAGQAGGAKQAGAAGRGEPKQAAEAGANQERGTVNEPQPSQALSRTREDHDETPAAAAPHGSGRAEEPAQRGDTLVGTHYSNAPRTNLIGAYYGTGIRGAERERIQRAVDDRIRNRSYFYVNKGKGINPGFGLGPHAHEATLDRMYNGSDNPEGIPSADMNHFESEVLNRGYTGYYTRQDGRQMGFAVRLGEHSNLPVQHVGTGPQTGRNDLPVNESRARTVEDSDQMRAKTAQIVKHLTPHEQELFTERSNKSLITAFEGFPTNNMEALAFAGRAKRGWYANSARTIANIFGPDAPRFAALLAALSPMRGVKDNLDTAVRIFVAWKKAGRPLDEKSILAIADAQARKQGPGRLMGGYRENTVTALSHDDPVGAALSGPKVDSFMRNLLGHTNSVTNDGWMAMIANVDEKLFGGRLLAGQEKSHAGAGYLGMTARTRLAAENLTRMTGEPWTPAEVQETVWSWGKTLYETAGALKMTAADVLRNGILDHELIASTPDFATLFHTDANEQFLKDAGYGEQLDAVRAGRVEPVTEGKVGGLGDEAAPFAQRTQSAHELAAAERLDNARFGNTAADRLAVKGNAVTREEALRNAEAAVERTKIYESPARKIQYGDLTQDQEDALKHVGGIVEDQTYGQRLKQASDRFGIRLQQGLLDQYRAIKEWSPVGHVLAVLAHGSDGTLESALMFGRPFMNGDSPDVDINDPTGGFAKVAAGVKGEHDRALWWEAAQRAEELKKPTAAYPNGRENLFTDDDIARLKTLSDGQFADGTDRQPAYEQFAKDHLAFNEAMLKIGRDSGIISDTLYNYMKDQIHVPFYRVAVDKEGRQLPSSGLTSQYFSRKLKGGDAQLKADLLDNVIQNWSHILSASAKNRAALRTVDDLVQWGPDVAEKVEPGTPGAMRVMRDGEYEHYLIHDPLVEQAMGSINYVPPNNAIYKSFGVMKRALTYGITASPIFKVRTLIRETLAATAQSEISNNALSNLRQGWKNTDIRSQIFASTLAGGGQIRFGSMEGGSRLNAMVKRAGGIPLDEGTMAKWMRMAKDTADIYHDFGNRIENVNRTALYEQLRAKGYSHTDASFAARDLLNFTASGRWPVVRFLNSSVPFMNARMQAVYSMVRTGAENPKKVGAVVAAISAASLGLMLTQQDEDWWKARENFDRDAYWAVKVGDQAYYIPKPFELGAIGTLAERTWELMFNKDMTARKWGANFGQTLLNTFALDPMPQLIKPAVAVYANKDPFSQRPIETGIDQTMRPQDRYDENTSMAARLLGELGIPNPMSLTQANYSPLSPKQIDYLLRGYFGSLATLTTSATDAMLRPMTGEGALPSWNTDKWSAGFVRDVPSNHSEFAEELYQKAAEVHQAFASLRMARETGDIGRAREIATDNAELLRARPAIDAAEKSMAAINKQMRQVEASKLMGSDEKKAMLDRLSQQRNAVAGRVHGLTGA